MLRNKEIVFLFHFVLGCVSFHLPAQQMHMINVVPITNQNIVTITANGKPFTQFIFPDSLEKPVLYPIYAPDGEIITRGFPLMPRAGESTDHPHHTGLWFNYENVNGLDFWNNSFAIPADKKHLYGWIRTNGIMQMKSGKKGILEYSADWTDQQKNILLTETTTFIFSANSKERIIDRITTLSAKQDVSFADAKDGLLGLRVAHELELPSAQPKKFTDNKGNVTDVAADTVATGNYLTSEGKQGDSAWATRAVWCLLYGKKNNDTISIAMIDHPNNPGYPTYWHARGYGLFAANPLGQKIFSNGKQVLNFSLKKGETVTFRYRIVIASGKEKLVVARINQLASEFAEIK
jgi:Methane oxygenase PmoA